MSLAAAPRAASAYAKAERLYHDKASGAQSLLHVAPPPPDYPARTGAILLYFLLLALFVTVGFKNNDTPIEEEQVVELAPMPVEEQPVEDTPPPPEAMAIPDIPPPPAFDPIAPVEEVKPVEKPKIEKPKVEKPKLEKPKAPTRAQTPSAPARPSRQPAHPAAAAKPAPHVAAPAVHAPPAPAGATISAAANAYHACLQRAAGSMEPPVGGRVTYHATVSATGAVTSFSITSSSNPSLASLAQRLGGRCGSVPAPGRPGSLSGGISFSGP